MLAGKNCRGWRGVSPTTARFICGACERPCAGVLLSSSRTLLALHHCRLASVPGLDPPLRTLFRATVSSPFCIPDAFGAAGSSCSSTPAAFGAAAAQQARLDPRSRTSTAPFPDAFSAACSSRFSFPDAFSAAGSSLSSTLDVFGAAGSSRSSTLDVFSAAGCRSCVLHAFSAAGSSRFSTPDYSDALRAAGSSRSCILDAFGAAGSSRVQSPVVPKFRPLDAAKLVAKRHRARRGSGCWPSRMAPARCRRLHAPPRPSPRHRGRRLGATFVILDSLLTATPSDGRQPRGHRRGSAAASGRRNHDVRHRRRGNELAVQLRCASRRDAATTPPPPLQPAPPTRCRSACRGQPGRFCGTATGDAGGRWFGSSGAGPSFWPRTARSFEPTARRRTLRSSPPTRPSLRGLVRPRPRCAGGSFSRTPRWQAHPAH